MYKCLNRKLQSSCTSICTARRKVDTTAFLTRNVAGASPILMAEACLDAVYNAFNGKCMQPISILASDQAMPITIQRRALARKVPHWPPLGEMLFAGLDDTTRAMFSENRSHCAMIVCITSRVEKRSLTRTPRTHECAADGIVGQSSNYQ